MDEMSQICQTTGQRVAVAMYPEVMDDDMDIPSTQYNGQPTAVQRLSEPSQMLKHAVVNLINYQDDAILATRAIPEIIDLLNDESQSVAGQAAMMVYHLSKNDASRNVIANSSQLVSVLLHLLEYSPDIETRKFCAKALHNISRNPQGQIVIFKLGGIRVLVQALSSPIDSIVFSVISILHTLMLYIDGAKMNVCVNGGLHKMVSLLSKNDEKFLAVLTDCIHMLTYANPESKLIILAGGGPAELVRIMYSFTYEKVLFTTARLIKVLSVCPSNKPALVQAGAMQALSISLNHQSRRLVQECLWALRNLSDSATQEAHIEPLLQKLVMLLDEQDINSLVCSLGILSNLACFNQQNKQFLSEIGAVPTLLRTLENSKDQEDIAEPASRALRNLSNRSLEPEYGQTGVTQMHTGGQIDMQDMSYSPERWL
ncbi:Armadillo segment polarity protein, partial [Fragariocoptes setiger]